MFKLVLRGGIEVSFKENIFVLRKFNNDFIVGGRGRAKERRRGPSSPKV